MDAILIETATNNSPVSVAAEPPQISANVSQDSKRISLPARKDHEHTGSSRENTTLARSPLDDCVPHARIGQASLRWIYVHMIEESARHAGHADILREQTDGATGFGGWQLR